jgi:hypothetical protein
MPNVLDRYSEHGGDTHKCEYHSSTEDCSTNDGHNPVSLDVRSPAVENKTKRERYCCREQEK